MTPTTVASAAVAAEVCTAYKQVYKSEVQRPARESRSDQWRWYRVALVLIPDDEQCRPRWHVIGLSVRNYHLAEGSCLLFRHVCLLRFLANDFTRVRGKFTMAVAEVIVAAAAAS